MGHTYTNIMEHGVFSTKRRENSLVPEIWPDLPRVVGGIVREQKGKLLALNGTENHVHLLMIIHPTIATADLFEKLKAQSSKWIHQAFPRLPFTGWQSGYGAFSVSKSVAESVETYIARQREHHHTQTFEEELVGLLEKHGIEYDRKYVFD